jgi:hypothetical protein
VDAELHYADREHAIGSIGNVFINIIRQPSTVPMVQEIRRQVERHFRRWNNQCVSIAVLEPTAAQSVPREVRDATAALTQAFPSLAAATVIEGTGFRAAATRTAVAGLFLLSRPPFPHRVFGTLDEGTSWILATGSRSAPIGPSAEAVLAAIAATRSAIT